MKATSVSQQISLAWDAFVEARNNFVKASMDYTEAQRSLLSDQIGSAERTALLRTQIVSGDRGMALKASLLLKNEELQEVFPAVVWLACSVYSVGWQGVVDIIQKMPPDWLMDNLETVVIEVFDNPASFGFGQGTQDQVEEGDKFAALALILDVRGSEDPETAAILAEHALTSSDADIQKAGRRYLAPDPYP